MLHGYGQGCGIEKLPGSKVDHLDFDDISLLVHSNLRNSNILQFRTPTNFAGFWKPGKKKRDPRVTLVPRQLRELLLRCFVFVRFSFRGDV